MINRIRQFDDMTLYEMMDHFEKGSVNWTRLDKSIKFRARLGLDHMTNREYLEYCERNREFIKEEIKRVFGKPLDSKNYTKFKNIDM